jgi:hypothetical protein
MTQPLQLIVQNALKAQPIGPHRPTSAAIVLWMEKIASNAQLDICIFAQETKFASPVELWLLIAVSVLLLLPVLVAITGSTWPMLPPVLLVWPIANFARTVLVV